MWLRIVTIIMQLVLLFIEIVVLLGLHSSESYDDLSSPNDYVNAYNSVYAPPRPSFYEDCDSYNKWVDDANEQGSAISSECKKKFGNDKRCPNNVLWVGAPCE